MVRLSALGDVLHALPVLSGLRSVFPNAHIAWAVEDRAAGLLADRSDLDAIHIYPRRHLSAARSHPLRSLRATRSFAKVLRAEPFDLVLDLQGNLKSGAISRLARTQTRFGPAVADAREGNSVFVRHHAGTSPGRHRVERNLALASDAVGIELPYVPPGFPRADSIRTHAAQLLREGKVPESFVVLHPGTSGFGAFKRWPTDRFAALGRRLVAQGETVVITGSASEQRLTLSIRDAMDGQAVVVTPPSLPVLADVIARATLFVSADTGPLHLAALVETPVLGLYGPKDPGIYGPYGRTPSGEVGVLPVLTQPDVACRPCTLRRCAAPLCMTTMDVEDVWERVEGGRAGTGTGTGAGALSPEP